MNQFEMTLPSTGDDILVEYEYLAADPSVGQPEGFDYSLSNEQGEIMYSLTDKDYETITAKIDAHHALQRQSDVDEAAIARWESNND
jgi:hypothetical protein